jgi:hypothetical protein
VTDANEEAASKYSDVLRKIIEDGGYTAQQIFNVDETSLFWKKLWMLTLTAIDACKWITHSASTSICLKIQRKRKQFSLRC